MEKFASTEQVAALNHRISLVEGQVSQIAKLAQGGLPTETALSSLREMIAGLHFYDPGDQSKNDAWYTPGGKVDTVEDHPKYPDSVTHPKTASIENFNNNAQLAEATLATVAETNDKIDALVTAGRRFNASRAKLDLHKIASEVQTILTDVDLGVPYVTAALEKLASEATRIHSLFSGARV